MIRLKDAPQQSTDAFLRHAISIAEYYGFTSLDEIARNKEHTRDTTAYAKAESDITFARRDERTLISAVRKILSRMGPQSNTLLAWRIVNNNKTNSSRSIELHILGTPNTIAEALLIIVGNAIAQESGVGERMVLINNIGSSESSGRYIRDVSVYLRKHLESISPTLRPRVLTDPLGTLVQMIERGHPATLRAPQAMEYLTEDERSRFWELLEYLEAFGLPYELSSQILGSRDCWSHSLFEISQIEASTGARIPIAFGGRYDPLISRFARAPRTATMISIAYENNDNSKTISKIQSQSDHIVPSIYFAHLGSMARQRSLGILEKLRQANIWVHQSIWQDRITEQMNHAQTLSVPYILILGHKEAINGTIIVREVATNSQSAVPIDDLVGYLKRHKAFTRTRVKA